MTFVRAKRLTSTNKVAVVCACVRDFYSMITSPPSSFRNYISQICIRIATSSRNDGVLE
jgi:CBS domain containing-hemolysin-like protein